MKTVEHWIGGAATPGISQRLLLGSCPDSWGAWFADDPRQTPWHRFLDGMAAVGWRTLIGATNEIGAERTFRYLSGLGGAA